MKLREVVFQKSLLLKAFLVLVMVFALAVAYFFLLTSLAYHFRMSVEAIRVGIVGIYFFPNLFGGLLLARMDFKPPLLWGIALGTGAFLGLCILSAMFGDWTMRWEHLSEFAVCVLSAVFGVFSMHKTGLK